MKKVLLFTCILVLAASIYAGGEANNKVYIIDVGGEIDQGLATIVERGISEAESQGAKGIVVNIDTFGGLVDAATRIRDTIFASSVPVITYTTGRAWSAGALIALAGDFHVMAPGSSIGAAEPIPQDEKYISALRSEFRSTAERRGRDPQLAMAMVDKDIAIEGIIEKDKLLALSAVEALEYGIADASIASLPVLLAEYGLAGLTLVRVEPRLVETFARAVTGSWLSGILLTLGFTGLVLEVFTAGWGVPGTIGLLSLAAFFSGHLLSGGSDLSVVILFIVGLFLLVLELVVIPGFGIAGLGGIIAIFASLFLVFPTTDMAMQVLAGSVGASILMIAVALKFLPRSTFWNRISLVTSETIDLGYVAPKDYKTLIGKVGETITSCRPAGTIVVDGERVDAVSEGGFIEKGVKVVILKVEGTRVVIRKKEEEEV